MGKWAWAMVFAVIALASIATACGGSDDSDSGGGSDSGASADGCTPGAKEELQAKLDEYRAEPEFESPGSEFDASKARGKKVFNIPLLSTDTFNQIVDKASAEAAKAAGLEFIQFNNEGDPAQWADGMNQAFAQNADLIILEGGPDPAALKPQLAEAERRGIPVISTHRFDVDAVDQALQDFELDAIVPAQHYFGSGELTAANAIVQSDCKVNALILEAADVQPTSAGITERFQEQLEKYCPDTCKAEAINMPFSDWAQKAAGEMQSRLNSDPTINYIAPNFDQGAIYARQAILSAGRTEQVDIVAYNGSAPVMQMLADGESVISEVGEPLEWIGWQNIDQALRILAGEEPVKSPTPVRFFDESNIAEAGDPVVQTKGYGPASHWEDGFRELWGLSG